MDPRYSSRATAHAILAVTTGAELEYELRVPTVPLPTAPRANKVVMLVGAFSTFRHFGAVADTLCEYGLEVLLLNHRGVGRSRPRAAEDTASQTVSVLAADAVALAEALWGPAENLHVFGGSMGGMVAQVAGARLAREGRLASLFLAVTAGAAVGPTARWISGNLPAWMMRGLVSAAMLSSPAAVVDVAFAPEYRNMRVGDLPASAALDEAAWRWDANTTVGEAWTARFTAEFAEWFTYNDKDVCASHAAMVATYALSEEDAATLAAASQRIAMWIADKDTVIAPQKQHELADTLRARKIVNAQSGHVVGSPAETEQLARALADHCLAHSA
ncbi:hypothetical protein HDU83_007751 [Entophlyctis luteolus]|nr:hypothetical protein HDU83_007751 [Entophlyctis luteolus]